ncbi:MAG: cobalamin biosynthesis protein CobQ, partial [Cyanobacteria bacterium J06576_12]
MASPFLKRYLLALDRYKWPASVIFLFILGASGLYAFRPEPPVEYYSEGALVDNSPLVAFSNTGAQVQTQGLGIINEELLLSGILLDELSAQLAAKGIELEPQQIKDSTRIAVISASDVDGADAVGSKVTVRFVGDDPAVTETVLTEMFRAMVELSQVTNRTRLEAITDELKGRLPAIETELREAEQDLEAYDRIEGPAIQASIDGSLLSSISGSQQQLRTNDIALAGINAQMRSIQSQLGMDPDQAYASSALSADPLVAQLRVQISETETSMALQSSQGLLEDHPVMVDLRDNLGAFETLLEQRSAEVLGGDGTVAPVRSGVQSNLDPARAALANQLVNLDAQREAIISQQQVIRNSAQDLRQQYSSLPNKQLERNRLAEQVSLRRELYSRLQGSLVDAEVAAAET